MTHDLLNSVLQCVAVCCIVLQCAALRDQVQSALTEMRDLRYIPK